MGFLNPGLLGLLGLGAVPIVIHLLNRRRYQVVAWPAMEFLLRAQVKTRKRLRMENLLLLLARTLAVLCFCLAASRPYLPSAAAAVGLQPERTHLYIVIDNSASMAYEEGMSSLLQRAVRKAQEDVDRLDGDDPVSVVLSCDNIRRRTGRPVALLRGTRDHSKVRDVLQRILSTPAGDGATGASDARLDPAASLATVMEIAEPGDPRRLLRVYSDFQRVDWAPVDASGDDESNAGASAVRTQLERLKEARFQVAGALVAVPEQPAVDVAVLSVEPQDGRNPSEGLPTAFEVVVANHGAATAAVDVRFRVDDREVGTRRLEVRGRASGSAAASTARATFPWTGLAGVHVATAEVSAEGNRLQRNDRRRHAFKVRDRVRVLAVDGDPNPGPGRFPETRLLETALSLSRGVLPMDVRVVPSSDLMRAEFDDTDVVLLANVDRLTDPTWERLRRWVRTGGGLWIFLGDKTDPSLWNGVTRRSETQDLLPARLEARPRFDADSPLSLELEESSHPSLRDLTDPRHGTSFEPPLVAGWWPVQLPLEDGVEVLLRYRDLDRTPALLERRVGRGRVLLCTTAADLDWAGPSLFFAPWIQETVSYLASAGQASRNLLVHGTIAAEISAAARSIEMKAPDGQNYRDLSAEKREGDEDAGHAVFFSDTALQGIYTLSWKQPPENGGIGSGVESREGAWAVNLDPREGDLSRLDGDDLRARFGDAGGINLDETGEEDTRASLGGTGDLTRLLLLAGLLLLVLEMFMASWFGRKRG